MDNLGRRKARVALTAVGVVIGTAAVVILVSLAIGLQRNANQQLYGIGDLSQIQVMPNYGDFPGGPGPMVVETGPGSPGQPPNQKLITDESLLELASLPGVEKVIPREYLMGGGILQYQRLETYPSIIAVGADDISEMGLSVQQGTTRLERGTAIAGAMVPRQFYDPR
ncbi:MAG: ABC transporter permease, partial [Anaerolineales bacterium]